MLAQESFYGHDASRYSKIKKAKRYRKRLGLDKNSTPTEIVNALKDDFTMERFNEIYCLGDL